MLLPVQVRLRLPSLELFSLSLRGGSVDLTIGIIMKIVTLTSSTINRIAAGEVVERPASAVKELLENSIDAGSAVIDIVIENGGRNLISIADNGCGMSKDEIEVAIERHTTSKLDEADITNIEHFGFRGEALPSIASVSRLTLTSKPKGSTDHAWSLNINGGEKVDLIPSSYKEGTKIEVRDLFFATPARLKFLKSEKVENQHIVDIVKKLAMAHPMVAFNLKIDNKNILQCQAQKDDESGRLARIHAIMGKDFANNSIPVEASREDVSLSGYIGLPTYNKGNSLDQYLFVNNRPVRDKLLLSSIRIAYQDFLSSNRYPVVVLFIEIPTREVDVNVHPTKAEVRFRDTSNIRGLIIGGLKNALQGSGHRASTTVSSAALSSFKSFIAPARRPVVHERKLLDADIAASRAVYREQNTPAPRVPYQEQQPQALGIKTEPNIKYKEAVVAPEVEEYPLGAACCQLHTTYVVAQTKNSIVIVDQHAAHERLVYEGLKKQILDKTIKTQRLLVPEIIDFDESSVEMFMQKKEELYKLGLHYENCGPKAIRINEVPAIIGTKDVRSLFLDLADDLKEFEEGISFSNLIAHILGTFACHHSVRAGKTLGIQEMNALLRKIENTPHSGQCNHGRPTYIELKLTDIEKLFGRS
jgi:DNA mismatch repair protein MutL